MTNHPLSRRAAFALFAIVVVTWGLNWPVTKMIVESVSPLWATAIRSAIASIVLLGLLIASRQLVLPRRGDVPVILAVACFHMVAFSALVAFGLQRVPVGRSIVLGYTTPLWVAPGAWILLGERPTGRGIGGIALGIAGLFLMFDPAAFDWDDERALVGNGLVLLAAGCWAVSILYVRIHTWISTPFQLVFWQTFVAAGILSGLALLTDGVPRIDWNPRLGGAFVYGGVCGTALAYWAMNMVNRSLPAVTTSLGILATPVVGVAVSIIVLGEPISPMLLAAMAMMLSGIAIGAMPARRRAAGSSPPAAQG